MNEVVIMFDDTQRNRRVAYLADHAKTARIRKKNTHTIICKNNAYGVTKQAADEILSQAREYAPQGAIYALRKDNTIMLINEQGNDTEYIKSGFEVLRKE